MHGDLLEPEVGHTHDLARSWSDGTARRAWPWSLGVFAAALTGSLLVYRYLWADPFHSTLGRNHHSNDPMQTIWNLKWMPWAVLHGHYPFHTNAIYYPHGVSLSWNTLTPTLGLAAAPVTLTLGAVFAYTALMTLGPALSVLTAFWWLRRHVAHPSAALAGAFVLGFGPFVAGHLQGHLDLTFLAFVPLILMCLEDLLWRHPRPAARTSLRLGLLTTAQAGVNEELLIITAVAVLVLAVCWAISDFAAVRDAARVATRPLLAAAAVFALTASPLLVDQLFLAPSVSLQSSLWRATVGDYLWPFTAQVMHFGPRFQTFLGAAENGVYLGPVMLFVLLAGFVASRNDRAVRCAAATLLVLVVLTFGPAHPFGIPLPWNAVGTWPVFMSVLPGRFAFGSSLVLAWLLAHWADRLLGARARPGASAAVRIGAGGALIAIAVALATWIPRPILTSPLPTVPSLFRHGSTALPAGAAVYLLPSSTPGDATGMYLQQAADFRFTMPGGYALHRIRGGITDGPAPSALIRLAEEAGTGYPVADLDAARSQLRQEDYAAIVVVDDLPDSRPALRLAAALTGRPADRSSGGVSIWHLGTLPR